MRVQKVAEDEAETITEQQYKTLLSEELERKGLGGLFVWSMFFLCIIPNIFNGFHISSYVLIGHVPEDQWCEVDKLQNTNWTLEQRRWITETNLTSKGCTVWDWDYMLLSNMTFDAALSYTTNRSQPEVASCQLHGSYSYQNPETTFVADWDLTCEKSLERTSAMFLISLGKMLGSIFFGVLADKYGRKPALTVGTYIFIISSFICTYAPWYYLFLIGRFGLGIAAPGFFYPALTIIVENVCFKHRTWMSICFLMSYSVGMIVLAGTAYLIQPWRDLHLWLTIPSLLLICCCYFINESVNWLITQQRYDEAYKILFKKSSHFELICTYKKDKEIKDENMGFWTKLRNGPLKQMVDLFATSIRRYFLISNFTFYVATLAYYVTALNSSNISLSRYLFVAFTGMVDLPSYILPVIMLRCLGQRSATMLLFWYAGIVNLLFLVAPTDNNYIVVTLAMLGRGGVLSSYSVMSLYHAEIYPTEIRNSALGACSMLAYFGALMAPYVVDYGGLIAWYIPTTVCGLGIFLAGLLHLNLPEIPKEKKKLKELNS